MNITQEQVDEFLKCKNDIVYFAENYVQHISPYDGGIKKLKLYPYQIQILEDDILTAETSRQIGFSLTSHIKILHSIIFNQGRTIVFYTSTRERGAYSIRSIVELLDLCTFPDELKPKLLTRDSTNLYFNNEMRLVSASNINHIGGYRISEFYMEEVDYYREYIESIEDLLHLVIECLPSHCKIWAWSCPANGNIDKVKEVLEKRKNHNHYNLAWYVIPNRDSGWKEQILENMSDEQFKREHLNDFSKD